LEDLKNQELCQKIVEKAVRSAKVREATRKAQSMARARNELKPLPW
jgi:DNA gyrase/topoisomerase IV subunit B